MARVIHDAAEWLEADGLGGFASGTASGLRTRRYHGLLACAGRPPGERYMLVNGVDARVLTAGGEFEISPQAYASGYTNRSPRVALESFTADPWPTWRWRLADGTRIVHEVFVPRGSAACALSWRAEGAPPEGPRALLRVRPLMSGRDVHALHHENVSARAEAREERGAVSWTPYEGVPTIRALHNGEYEHAPVWYRGFLYTRDRERGFDAVEDLLSPGVVTFDLSRGAAAMVLSAQAPGDSLPGGEAATVVESIRAAERTRRVRLGDGLERAAASYVVRRGEGLSIIAGYPWFLDWGRDTCIAVRGLCVATGRFDEARRVLLTWAEALSEGMLPNRFADAGDTPEYNSVDAALWFVVAVRELLERASAAKQALAARDARVLADACRAVLSAYARGTRHGIRMDEDGLLACGEPGVQLTWMDARVDGRVITPRIGKPVEVQALWLSALDAARAWTTEHEAALEKGLASFNARFWNPVRGCLYDVVDDNHVRGACDGTIRPNQVFAAGGLPLSALSGERARAVVDVVESRLCTPMGLRTLAPGEPGYAPHYRGGPAERDAVYHQGPAWPWLMGAFVEAWVRVRGSTAAVRREARERFLEPMLAVAAGAAGIGHLPELADAETPHTGPGGTVWGGCPFQAWSVGEAIRVSTLLDAGAENAAPAPRAARARRKA